MGSAFMKPKAELKPEKKMSQFENQLIERLAALNHIEMHGTHLSFNRIILQFPHLETAFKTVRQTFKVFDMRKKEEVSFDDMKTVLASVGATSSDLDLQGLFSESDLDSSGGLDFREFLVRSV